MKSRKIILSFWGRIFISVLFILLGVNKILNWQESEKELTVLLGDWQSLVSSYVFLRNFFTFLLQWVPAVLLFFTVIQLLGGILVFLGTKIKFGAFLLVIVVFTSTFIYYPFWLTGGVERELRIMLFLKNFAILGGLFYLLIWDEDKKKLPSLSIKSSKGTKEIPK